MLHEHLTVTPTKAEACWKFEIGAKRRGKRTFMKTHHYHVSSLVFQKPTTNGFKQKSCTYAENDVEGSL